MTTATSPIHSRIDDDFDVRVMISPKDG